MLELLENDDSYTHSTNLSYFKTIENIIRAGISKNLGQIDILHKKILRNAVIRKVIEDFILPTR